MKHTIIRQNALLAGLVFLAGFYSCEKELDLNLKETPAKMVVEGWIENGRYAEIILSHSAPYFSSIDSNSIMQFAETHAKVTLFSGTDEEIMTLKPNQKYFPPYVYRSVDIQGITGQTYTIEVVSQGDTVLATTTIPEPVDLDSVWYASDPGMNTRGRLWIRLTDDASRDNYYRLLYKRKGKDDSYMTTNIYTFSDALFNGKTMEMGFLRGFSSVVALEDENYFESGDTISVKFCTIDEEQYNFWKVYQSKVLTSANPLAISNNQLKSNIIGGLGIWTGYGTAYYLVYAQ